MEKYKLIIIGAGASGIAAASKLLENGFGDFKILEAENRIGGRINSFNLENESIEIGAEWIHGEKNNVVYEMASKHNLADNTPVPGFENTNFFDSSGNLIDKDFSTQLTNLYREIIYSSNYNLPKEVLNGSIGSHFDTEFNKKLSELKKNMNVDLDLCKKFADIFEKWENCIDGSDSWYKTSLIGHLEYWECDGNILTVWKNKKYDTVFKLLTKKIPDPDKQLPVDEKIIFNKEVIKINWKNDNSDDLSNVEIQCLDGSSYHADHVLFTCSLGVLKDRGLKLFSPSLPVQKLKCIENLEFGTVDKIFVIFEKKWWGEDYYGFGLLWSEEEIKNDSSGWLSGVVAFHPLHSKSEIMRGWITGDAAKHMENLSNEEIIQGLNFLFEKYLGVVHEISPVKVCISSKWYSNPHFRGSYSCRILNSETFDVWASQLAEPICDATGKPILLFAGEATHDHYFSTVHGAIETGQREAGRILPIISNDYSMKHKKVVIVGAGISGLSAAKALISHGITDIIVLEAQSYAGGRVRSLQVGDYILELGAQWIHGEKNEIFDICLENGLLSSANSTEKEGLYLRENGEVVDDILVEEVDNLIEDILDKCNDQTFCQTGEKIPVSLGQDLLSKFNEYLDNCKEDTEEIKTIKRELFDWHDRFLLIDNSCFSLDNLSAKAWGLFKYCGGSEYVNFKNGYSSFVHCLLNSLPDDLISYNNPVECIKWVKEVSSGCECDSRTLVCCNNGDVYSCQYVIVTTSLGYLKNNHKAMFRPSLPVSLVRAIDYIGFGIMNKIFLLYEKPWWEPEAKGFKLLWSLQKNSDTKNWRRYISSFDVLSKDKPILLGWVAGEGAKQVEEIPEEIVGKEATEILRKFTKNSEIPLPAKVIVTKWWTNEYFRGAYSHITVKCDDFDINGSVLCEPVCTTVNSKTGVIKKPTIILAGESCHKSYFSTVHGAYESGQSQAQIIINDTEKQNIDNDGNV